MLPLASVEDLEDEIALNKRDLDRCLMVVRSVSPEAEIRRLERVETLQRWDRGLRADLASRQLMEGTGS